MSRIEQAAVPALPERRAETVAAVCRRLLAEAPYDGTDGAARALTERALAAFAADDLLRLRFIETGHIARGDMHDLAHILEVFAAHSHTLMSVFLINAIFGATALALFGSPEQKQQLLSGLCAGKRQLAFALTEPNAGSDAAGIETTFRREGFGYEISGVKHFITGADVADYLLVVARDSTAEARQRTETVFVVPRDARGLRVTPMPKLAGNVHASCRVELESVQVGEDAVLGGPQALHKGWPMLRRLGAFERFAVAAVSVGLASAVVERALSYARERRQFGRRIGEFQAIQFTLVDMRTLERAMRLLVREAAEALETQSDPVYEVVTAKAYCAEKLQEIVAAGMRVMGGRAYFDFEPMSRYYREAPWVLYAGGIVEIQKRLAARSLGLG